MTILLPAYEFSNIIGVIVFFILVLLIFVFHSKIYRLISARFFSDEKAPDTLLPGSPNLDTITSNTRAFNYNALKELINATGYAYSPKKDLFFSTAEAWQRKMGYCRLYDEAAAPLGMIVDSEPIYFSYEGKNWLIEFWKGQYDMTMGCEVGVYNTTLPELNIPGIFNGTFYNCVSDEDTLYMSFELFKNNELIVTREDKHWWLTGFKLGEYCEPYELAMNVYINFKSRAMRDAFVEALKDMGYKPEEYDVQGEAVAVRFDKPYSKQPITRTIATDIIIQKKNKLLCEKYQSLTKGYETLSDKLNAIKESDPDLYKEIYKIGKTEPLFVMFDKLQQFLSVKSDDNNGLS